MPVLARSAEAIFVVLWAGALLHIFWPAPWLEMASAALTAAYVLVAFLGARPQVRVLCGAMAAVAVAVGAWTGNWAAMPRAGTSAASFAAFFGTLALMRAAADARPEIARARALVARLGEAERVGALTVGAHFLGAVLSISVMAIFAPIIGRDASPETRRNAAEACQRGMCLACLWSPFWIAMAFAYQHLPKVKLWQIMTLGLALSTLGMLVAQVMYSRSVGIVGLWRALKGFAPVLPPLGVAAAVVLGLTAATPLSTLQSLVLGIPVLCVGGLLAQGLDRLVHALGQARRGIGGVSGEMVLLSVALALGRMLEGLLAEGAVTEAIARHAPPAALVIAIVAGGITVLALIGVHQLVGATVALAVFSNLPLGVSDLALMEAMLLGWAFSSMCGLSAVSVAAAGTMFGVPLERIAYGPNLRFLAIYGVLSIALLAAVNAAT